MSKAIPDAEPDSAPGGITHQDARGDGSPTTLPAARPEGDRPPPNSQSTPKGGSGLARGGPTVAGPRCCYCGEPLGRFCGSWTAETSGRCVVKGRDGAALFCVAKAHRVCFILWCAIKSNDRVVAEHMATAIIIWREGMTPDGIALCKKIEKAPRYGYPEYWEEPA